MTIERKLGMADVTRLKSNSLIEGRSSYSRGIAIGDWIVLANTAGRNFSTREMPADAAGQAEQMFRNVEGALKALGAKLADVVRARVSVPDGATEVRGPHAQDGRAVQVEWPNCFGRSVTRAAEALEGW